jgi:hypothetical protein
MLKLGIASGGSTENSYASPYSELSIDHHRLKASISYKESIELPKIQGQDSLGSVGIRTYSEIETVNKTVGFSGRYRFSNSHFLISEAEYIFSDGYHFHKKDSLTEFLVPQTDNIEGVRALLLSKNDFGRFKNSFSLSLDRLRLKGDGMFLPY